ncbi:MAG: T9SS type A sorting domain-containing protein [Melioribacteraceae bacterium]|nr:T9SS type A sorting domain-containing protein [Melioribacteraceae bacterium]
MRNRSNITAILLIIISLGVSINGQQFETSLTLINRDVNNKIISESQSVLQKIYSVFDKSRINKKYFSTKKEKCATHIINEYLNIRPALPSSLTSEIDSMIYNNKISLSLDQIYTSPSGIFDLHYTLEGDNAVIPDDDNANGIPDYVERVAEYFDHTWSITIDSLGYTAPKLDNGKFNIEFLKTDYYGYTLLTQPKIIMNSTFRDFPPNDDPEGDILGAAKVTAAHEFKHATQFAYITRFESTWFMEVDATWMEEIIYDQVNDYYNYMSDSQIINPARPLPLSNGYSDSIFMHFLTQKFGNGFNADFWNLRDNVPISDVFPDLDYILSLYGSSLDVIIPEYFSWNYFCGNKFVPGALTYEEAKFYPDPNICTVLEFYPAEFDGCEINYYGANYIEYYPGDNNDLFSYEFNGAGANFSVNNIVISDSTVYYEKTFKPATGENKFILPRISIEAPKIVVIPVVNSRSDVEYNYSISFRPQLYVNFIHTPLKDTEQLKYIYVGLEIDNEYDINLKEAPIFYFSTDSVIFRQQLMLEDKQNYYTVVPLDTSEVRIYYYFSIEDYNDNMLYYPSGAPDYTFSFFAGSDKIPPVITPLTNIEDISGAGLPLDIIAKVTDNLGADSGEIEYFVNFRSSQTRRMIRINDSLFIATIDSADLSIQTGDIFGYRISAKDKSLNGNRSYFPADDYYYHTIVNAYRFNSEPFLLIPQNSEIVDSIYIHKEIVIDDIDIVFESDNLALNKTDILITTPEGTCYNLILSSNSNSESIYYDKIRFNDDAVYSFSGTEYSDLKEYVSSFKPYDVDYNELVNGNAFGCWRISVKNYAGNENSILKNWTIILRGTYLTSENNEAQMKFSYMLYDNYPNPFNPTTNITYELKTSVHINLSVFNVLGELVAVLDSGYKKPGKHSVIFNAAGLQSGVYFYKLVAGEYSVTKKLILLK